MKAISLISFVLLNAAAFAVAGPVSVLKTVVGAVKADSYIITLKPDTDKAAHLSSLAGVLDAGGRQTGSVTYDYGTTLHGYSATLRGNALIQVLSSKDVASVEPDSIVTISPEAVRRVEQIAREEQANHVDRRASTCGGGVIVYAFGTGIQNNTCFGGRATLGAIFGGYAAPDVNGFGTLTAGVIACNPYGQAPCSTIIEIKTFSDTGSASYSDIIAGVNYATSAYKKNPVPSIALLPFAGPTATSLDNAVQTAITAGLTFVVASGETNQDVSGFSPARLAAALTVGSVNSTNVKVPTSNYGAGLDIWGLGIDVPTCNTGGPGEALVSGSAAGASYVTGILAVVLGKYGSTSPANNVASLKSHAQAIVTGQPSGTTNLKATVF